jgi:hypothetical protein
MRIRTLAATLTVAALALLAAPRAASAHCDTLEGPVVSAARQALAAGDVGPVLKWVTPAAEPEIRDAFRRTLAVRGASDEARELADQFFFETLVRVHRQGEGFPYTGLAPAGTPASPAIRAADAALESGNADALVKALTEMVAAGVKERFAHAREARQHATHDVEAGRRFVAAYVALTHYAEAIESAGEGHAGHEPTAKESPAHAHQ